MGAEMNFWAKKIIMILGVIVGTLLMSFFWMRYPDYFFTIPKFIVNFVADRGAGCCEATADYEFLIVFIFSFLTISVFLSFIYVAMRFFRGK
jgi:hypothetical protein